MSRYFAAWADARMLEEAGEGHRGRILAVVYDLDAQSRIGDTYHINFSVRKKWQSQDRSEVIERWKTWREEARTVEDAHPTEVYDAVLDLLENHPLHANWWATRDEDWDFSDAEPEEAGL